MLMLLLIVLVLVLLLGGGGFARFPEYRGGIGIGGIILIVVILWLLFYGLPHGLR